MKKKLTYPLLALVIVLWGAIFYRVFSGLRDDSPLSAAQVMPPPARPSVTPRRDDSLLLNYRDPFLNQAHEETPIMEEDSPAMTYTDVAEAPAYIDWSMIQYLGSVKSSEGGEAIALLNINGREYMLKPGENVDGITLMGHIGNAVSISYQGQVTTIAMQSQ